MVEILLLIVPPDQEGALESLILESICENEQDRRIVERCKKHVDEIQPLATKYIGKKRLKTKAYLGVTWAIQYPEKVFSLIDEQMQSIRWADSTTLQNCFKQLIDI